MIGKIIWLSVCVTAIVTQAGAQVGIELNGGLQGTKYQLQNGQDKLLPGASLGLDYTFRLGNQFGLITGILGGIYRTQASFPDGLVFNYNQVDDEGSAFQYSLTTKGYKETQRFFAATIPLLLQYHTADEGTQWWFDAGGKVFFPFNSSIQVSARQLNLSGYYPDYNLEVGNLPQHGFGTIDNWKTNATTVFKPTAALSAGTGLSFKMATSMRLYVGVYADYGLTDLKQKNGVSPLATYNSGGITGVQAFSVLNMPNAGKVSLLSFGLQVKLGLGNGRVRPAVSERRSKIVLPMRPDSTMNYDDSDLVESPVVFGILDQTDIPGFQEQHLDKVATFLKQHPNVRLSLVGHSCGNGIVPESPKLGDTRARAVARYLENKGIDARRLDVSFSPENDLAQPADAAANYASRRVEITMH
jgi:outer membrane protein OmpA-like peptidoglycan-associated protein